MTEQRDEPVYGFVLVLETESDDRGLDTHRVSRVEGPKERVTRVDVLDLSKQPCGQGAHAGIGIGQRALQHGDAGVVDDSAARPVRGAIGQRLLSQVRDHRRALDTPSPLIDSPRGEKTHRRVRTPRGSE